MACTRVNFIRKIGSNVTNLSSFRSKLIQKRTIASLNSLLIKRQALVTNFGFARVVPVNKFDLSSGDNLVLNAVSVPFSTAIDAAETEELSQSDDDIEKSKENRWPSPVSPIQSKKKPTTTYTVFVGGEYLVCNEVKIAELLSKFGKVLTVDIPLKHKYLSNENETSDSQSYKYAFVSFDSEESMSKALSTEFCEYNDNGILKKIDIKTKTPRNDSLEREKERIVTVRNLPSDISVLKVYDYFKTYGKIELINMVFSETLFGGDKQNYAYVLYNSPDCKETVLKIEEHKLGDSPLLVSPASQKSRSKLRRDRSRKVMLEKLTEETNADIIKQYLSEYGDVKEVTLLRSKSDEFRGIAVAEFVHAEDAMKVTSDFEHDIGGQRTIVRAMGALF